MRGEQEEEETRANFGDFRILPLVSSYMAADTAAPGSGSSSLPLSSSPGESSENLLLLLLPLPFSEGEAGTKKYHVWKKGSDAFFQEFHRH